MSATADPWFKFFGFDWRADERLAICSLAARGLWLEMLILMHMATPRGHLLVNGKPPTNDQLAVLVRASADQVRELSQELESAGVFSRTRTGVIFSRRMVRDTRVAADGRKAAQKRWKSARSASPQPPVTKGETPHPNGSPTGVPNTHIPEAREERERKNTPPPPSPGGGVLPFALEPVVDLDAEFEAWWLRFPKLRRRAKAPVKKRWMALIRQRRATLAQLVDGLNRYLAAGWGESAYAMQPSTWLGEGTQGWTVETWDPPGDVKRAKPAGPPRNGL